MGRGRGLGLLRSGKERGAGRFNVKNNDPDPQTRHLVRVDDAKLCEPAGGELAVEFWVRSAALTHATILARDDGKHPLFRIGAQIIEDTTGKRTVFSDFGEDGNGGCGRSTRPSSSRPWISGRTLY